MYNLFILFKELILLILIFNKNIVFFYVCLLDDVLLIDNMYVLGAVS